MGNSPQSNKIAWSEFPVFLLTIVIAITGVIGTWLIKGQLSAMERQLDLMEADQRPWISIKPENLGDLVFSDVDAKLTVSFRWKNIGKSPALNTWASYYLIPKYQDVRAMTAQIVLCENMQVADKDPSKVSRTLFPAEEFESEETATTELAVLKPENFGSKDWFDQPLELYLVGCIQYQSGGGKLHRTPFAYEIIRSTYPHTIKKNDRVIPGSHLSLSSRKVQTHLNPE